MSRYNLPIFPFSAIVGQEQMKLSLILNAIEPGIGGVLIRGEKGTAKSTAVRALARLLPDMEVVKNCPFHCNPYNPMEMCEDCKSGFEKKESFVVEKVSYKVVNVPLGITEDRLIGTLNIEKVLKDGRKHFEPGILALANRGILYIDEVNLLDDHLVDELLDVAAMGVNLVEREGISFSHPSKFILVGTMNPEEGELRPQLLDRFGLCVNVETVRDAGLRTEIIKRRISFDDNPFKFIERWDKKDLKVSHGIEKARKLNGKIREKDWVYDLISRICIIADVDGHRADTCILKTAKAYAAWSGRTTLVPQDFIVASSIALPHRLKKKPFDEEKKIEDLYKNLLAVVKEYSEKDAPRTVIDFKEKKSLHA